MYQDFNEQFANATRQFADTATQVNSLALENAEKVFGLQLATFEENVNAAFAFWGEVAQVRDFDGLKAALPKGAQVARENVERAVSTGQEVFGRTLKANEAIAQIAKIGRAHVGTPVPNAHLLCRLLLEKKKKEQ